jgi:hypothetical protein
VKNFIFIALIFVIVAGVFLGPWILSFHPRSTSFDTPITFQTEAGETLTIAKQNTYDSIFFCGYRNCGTVCSRALPILERIAEQNDSQSLHVYFLDLTKTKENPGNFLNPESFPHIRWISLPASQAKVVLSHLGLEAWSPDHHSGRLLFHRGGTASLIWEEQVRPEIYKHLRNR